MGHGLPGPGPAKEAARPFGSADATGAPQRGTATGALYAEAWQIVNDAMLQASKGAKMQLVDGILALVKRELEPLDRDLAAAKERIASLETTVSLLEVQNDTLRQRLNLLNGPQP